jgi:hypothetical protein
MSTESPTPEPPKRNRNPSGRNQYSRIQDAEASGDSEAAEYARKSWRDRYQADGLIETLHNHVRPTKGARKVKLSGSQIKAAELILDRLEPRLSAVEQTQVNPDDLKPPLELLRELAPLLRAHPEWLRELGFIPAPLEVVDERTLDGRTAESA